MTMSIAGFAVFQSEMDVPDFFAFADGRIEAEVAW